MSYENVELNPLCRPPIVCDLIFQHLNGKELLVASEVHPSFYNFIAESKNCMKKIILKLEEKALNEDDKQLIAESGRNYENIEVNYWNNSVAASIGIFSMPERKWKHVVSRNAFDETATDLFTYLDSNVESLCLYHMYSSFNAQTLRFPNLRRLEITGKMCLQTFINCKNLESIAIEGYMSLWLSADDDALQKILHSNLGLRKLKTFGILVDSVFNEDLASIVHFNLTEWIVGDEFYKTSRSAQLSEIASKNNRESLD